MGKTALVLGGGGSRGAYEAGVWKALDELGVNIRVVTGSSVGALNGAMVAQHALDEALDMWQKLSTDKIMNIDVPSSPANRSEYLGALGVLAREALMKRGADTTPLRDLLNEVIDEEKVRASDIPFGIVTVSVPDIKPHALFVDEIEKGKLIDYLLASAAAFPAMRAHEIDKAAYIDGGYFNNLPIDLALSRCDADDVVAVELNAVGIVRKPSTKIPVRHIRPEWDLGVTMLFDPSVARRNIHLGYLDAMMSYGRYEGALYAVEPEGFWERTDEIVRRMILYFNGLDPKMATGAGNDLAIAPLKAHISRYLRSYYKNKHVPEWKIALAMTEGTARLFDVDPARVYTAGQFESTVLEKAAASEPEHPMGDINSLLGGGGSTKKKENKAIEMGKRIDRREIAMYLEHLMCEKNMTEPTRRRLVTSGFLFPTEFLAAMYIKTLTEDK